MEHIDDDLKVLKELYGRTVQGGYLYVSVPFCKGESLSQDDLYHGHIRTGYQIEEIQNLIEQAGFNTILKPKFRFTYDKSLLSILEILYFELIKYPDNQYINFTNFNQLSFCRKAILALIWPFYRFTMELDIIINGIPENSIMLLAQK